MKCDRIICIRPSAGDSSHVLALLGIVLLCPLPQPRIRRAGRGFRRPVFFLDAFRCVLLFRVCFFRLAVPAAVSPVAAAQGLRESADQTRRDSGLRWHGSGTCRTIHRRRQLPNLAKLRERGTFRKLRTTYPGDFSGRMVNVHDRRESGQAQHLRFSGPRSQQLSAIPVLGGDQGTKAQMKIGKYTIPLGGARIKGMRKGTPFWHWLGEAGIFCSVIRVPVTFPPEKFPGVLLSGMCVPDLKGSQGTFCLVHDPRQRRQVSRGRRSRSHRARWLGLQLLRPRSGRSADGWFRRRTAREL